MMNKPALKKGENKKWRNTIAIFIAVFLVLSSLRGFVKTDLTGKSAQKSKWDDFSSFAVSLGSSASSLFIFQKDPKRAVVLSLGENNGVSQNGKDVLKNISLTFGASVENYIKLKNNKMEKIDDISKTYTKFISWITPIQILTTGWGENNMNTNISRIEALRLWWQLKSVGVNSLITADLSSLVGKSALLGNEKVLAASTQEFNREIAKYLENIKIVNEDYQINIINSSGEYAVSRLANSFITSVGGRVGSITGNTNSVSKCILMADKKSYTASYLANIFNCDIKDASQTADDGQITLVLGTEFAKRYFE